MKIKAIRFFRFFAPVFLWMAVIFTFSSLPTRGTSEVYLVDFVIKKTAHVIEYAVLSVLLYRAFMQYEIDTKRAGMVVIAFAVFYGATDEFHQSFTPGREPHVRDVLFDTIGAIIAVYGIWNILPKAPRRLLKLAENYQLL